MLYSYYREANQPQRPKQFLAAGCKRFYFCCKVGLSFNNRVCGTDLWSQAQVATSGTAVNCTSLLGLFFSSDGYCLHHEIKVIETCGEMCLRSAKDFPLGFIYVLRLVLNLHRSLIKAYVRTTKGSGVWFRQQMQGDSSCCTFSSTGLHLCRLKLLGVLILVVFSTFFT